jgi:hypothetical protein
LVKSKIQNENYQINRLKYLKNTELNTSKSKISFRDSFSRKSKKYAFARLVDEIFCKKMFDISKEIVSLHCPI